MYIDNSKEGNLMASSEFSALRSFLQSFVAKFEPALDNYLAEKKEELSRIDEAGAELVEEIRRFASGGGKRIRAALVNLGFRITGGEGEKILLPTVGMELMHTFFLIHDDIMDRSDTRRNKPTLHRTVEERYRDLLENTGVDQQHFGHSMAILAGDLCCAIAYEALARSSFPPERILGSIQKMHEIVGSTVTGQALDMVQPLVGQSEVGVVEKIHLLKTAKYTIEGPIHMGLILGGAKKETLATLSEYALPTGMAFQIQDDILGIFGTEQELGKSVTSDIEEAKQTLLTAHVFRHGTLEQKAFLQNVLGKRIATEKMEEVRRLMVETGALAAAENRARELATAGKHKLENIALPEEIRNVLMELADFVVARSR